MTEFKYYNHSLHVENVSIEHIASKVGTPFYCYSLKEIKNNYDLFSTSLKGIDALICFSVKSNSNLAILKFLSLLGAGFDVVSGGELKKCITAGASPEKIVFSGVGKTTEELELSLEMGIGQINVESKEELYTLNKIAIKKNKKANIALRVNPDITANTHEKISTGKKQDKFGILWDDIIDTYHLADKLEGIKINGLAIHIGSQILELDPFKIAFNKISGLVKELRNQKLSVDTIDLGGGLGIDYENNSQTAKLAVDYGKLIKKTVHPLGCKILLEPGRFIAANSGILITKVIYDKKTDEKNFLIVDAAMNDLLRPALYNAYHSIVTVKEIADQLNKISYDIVGPICETGDIFAKNLSLPRLKPNDLLAFRSVGAYGSVMSSQYNGRQLIPEVLVNNKEFSLVRTRPPVEDLWHYESIPKWIK